MSFRPDPLRALLTSVPLLLCAAVALGEDTDLELVPADAVLADQVGTAVALEGETIVAGAPGHDHDGNGSGAVYILVRDGNGYWIEQQELLPSITFDVASFGRSVALDGDTLVVGAPLSDVRATDGGAAYVFTRDVGGTWAQQQQLVPSDLRGGDNFGFSVALDGDTILVGSPYADSAGEDDTGCVYVFVRSGGAWTQDDKLVDPVRDELGHFGRTVAIDGDTLLAGAPGEAYSPYPDPPHVHVFVRSAGDWAPDAVLMPDQHTAVGQFGAALAMRGDRFLIGDPDVDYDGAAYVVDPDHAGGWSQTKLAPSAGDGFGFSVAMTSDLIAVGSRTISGDGGAVRLFRPEGNDWTELAKVTGSWAERFGYAVAVEGDLVVGGAPSGQMMAMYDAGSVRLYYIDGPKIVEESLPDWTEGMPYGHGFTFTGGTHPVRWELQDGALPVAEDIDSVTGGIQGVARPAGDYDFTLRVTDADLAATTRRFSMLLNQWPRIASTRTPYAVLDRPYDKRYFATLGTPGHTWSVAQGQPPPGFTFDSTGLLAGRPTDVGLTEFEVRCTDSCGAQTEEDAAVEVVPVVDLERRKHKQTVPIAPGDRPFVRALELLEGTQIDVIVKLPEKDAPLTLGLLDSRQREIDVSEWTETKRKSIRLRRYVVPVGKTGRYFVVLRAAGPVTGSAKVTIKVRPSTGRKGRLQVHVNLPTDISFGVLPGARVTIIVKAEFKGSDMTPGIVSVMGSEGELLVPEELVLKPTSAVLKIKAPVPGGRLTVSVNGRGNAWGGVTYKVRIKQPRKYLYTEPDLPADGTP